MLTNRFQPVEGSSRGILRACENRWIVCISSYDGQKSEDHLLPVQVNAGNKPTPQLDAAIETMCRKTRDLRRQLRKAVVSSFTVYTVLKKYYCVTKIFVCQVDHVSDSFLGGGTPLVLLVEAALAGDERQVRGKYLFTRKIS